MITQDELQKMCRAIREKERAVAEARMYLNELKRNITRVLVDEKCYDALTINMQALKYMWM